MTELEYVSAGLALVYPFTVARIVCAFPALFVPERRYWVSGLRALLPLLAAIGTWWSIWALRDVAWNPLRFVWALTLPSQSYVACTSAQ
jgi:hypothetical protein